MKCDVDAVVAGAGLWGCTVARRLADAGRRVLVLERRAAVGGNCRSEIDLETDIEIHTYGSHIFHTDPSSHPEDPTAFRYFQAGTRGSPPGYFPFPPGFPADTVRSGGPSPARSRSGSQCCS